MSARVVDRTRRRRRHRRHHLRCQCRRVRRSRAIHRPRSRRAQSQCRLARCERRTLRQGRSGRLEAGTCRQQERVDAPRPQGRLPPWHSLVHMSPATDSLRGGAEVRIRPPLFRGERQRRSQCRNKKLPLPLPRVPLQQVRVDLRRQTTRHGGTSKRSSGLATRLPCHRRWHHYALRVVKRASTLARRAQEHGLHRGTTRSAV